MMKKSILFLVGTFLFFNTASFAQKEQSSDKCIEEGAILFDAYYGFPYIMGVVIAEANSASSTGNKIVNYNHLGGKFEFMVSDIVGVGFDYTYAKVTNHYSGTYSSQVNGQWVSQKGDFSESIIKQRILAKVNIHFATSHILDPYATGGFGYRKSVYTTNNPDNSDYVFSFFNSFPIAFRMGVGMRVFFTKNIGVCVETGIGGPILQGGLTIKF